MGKFIEFLLSEELGLADIGPRINQLFHGQRFNNQIAGAYLPSDFTGSEQFASHPPHLPSTDLTIPTVVAQGRIVVLHDKKNPIYVKLSDGTEAHFSYDEWRYRVQGEPELGKVMTITFQRHPNDISKLYSKIDKAIVSN